MRAGFGISDLTPPLSVELAGYGYYLERRCDRVRDALHARAALIEDDAGARQLIVSCELLGLSQPVADEVIRHAASLGCGADRVILVSVHTHTGPTVKYHEGTGEVDERYVSTLAGRINRAADAACADLAPVTELTFAQGQIPGDYLYNRAAPEGPVDRSVRGFVLRRAKSAPIALISAACHGVFLGRQTCVSADFSGEIDALLEQAGYRAVYINGLCGDIDPWQPSETRMKEFAQEAVRAFLASAHTALPLTLEGGRLAYSLRLTPVTRQDIAWAAEQAEQAAGGPGKPAARVARAWEQEMLSRFDTLRPDEPGSVAWCALGGVPVFALPFEGFTRIGMDIRSRIGREDALMLGCAEELKGYLPTRDDIARGAYAALESTFLYRRLPVVPGEAERLAETLSEEYLALRGGHIRNPEEELPMQIRELSEPSLSEILPLYESVGWVNYTRDPGMLERALRGSLCVLGAYDENNALRGLIRAVGDGSSILLIQDLLVHPDARRQGVGTALVRSLLARYPGIYQVQLMTDETEENAAFYRFLGFVPAAEAGCSAFLRFCPHGKTT